MERNTLIKLLCIVVLIILNVSVIINGLNLSCSQCKLVISTNDGITKTNQDVYLVDVYNQFLNGTCMIEKTKNNFIVHGLP